MKHSDSTPDESVEQHTQSPNGPQLETCPTCGVDGLPERIADHECQTRLEHTHLKVVDHPTSLSTTNPTEQPDPHSHAILQDRNNTIPVDHITIEWTPTYGPARELTFEHTDTGWHRIEATQTDTQWQTTSDEPSRPPTLKLTTPVEEGPTDD
jgi:hypothetical protein